MIDFSLLPETKILHMREGNGAVFSRSFEDETAKFLLLTLPKGSSIGPHSHLENFEAIYILSGKAHCGLDEKEEEVKKGQLHYCPKGSCHFVENRDEAPLVLFAIIPKRA